MAAKVWSFNRHSNDVAGSGRNVAVTSGADVGLVCFVGLDSTHLNFETHRISFLFGSHNQPKNAHATRPRQITAAAPTMT